MRCVHNFMLFGCFFFTSARLRALIIRDYGARLARASTRPLNLQGGEPDQVVSQNAGEKSHLYSGYWHVGTFCDWRYEEIPLMSLCGSEVFYLLTHDISFVFPALRERCKTDFGEDRL